VRRREFRGVGPGTSRARTNNMSRDIRLFILGHVMLIAVAVLGSI
jgi:hypothetical protein